MCQSATALVPIPFAMTHYAVHQDSRDLFRKTQGALWRAGQARGGSAPPFVKAVQPRWLGEFDTQILIEKLDLQAAPARCCPPSMLRQNTTGLSGDAFLHSYIAASDCDKTVSHWVPGLAIASPTEGAIM